MHIVHIVPPRMVVKMVKMANMFRDEMKENHAGIHLHHTRVLDPRIQTPHTQPDDHSNWILRVSFPGQ